MRPEIAARLEQVRRGALPDGYKRGKAGILPVDWNEYPLSTIIEEYTEKTTIPNQYPVLTSARTGLMLQTDYYANRQVTTENNVGYHVLPYGYVTFRSRSDDGRFRFNENRIIEKGIISYFYPVFKFNASVCQAYLLETLNYTIYRRMYPYAEGTAQQVLSMKKLGALEYICPPPDEQRKIADVLAAQDKIIALQERLITEKTRQKRYLMQQYLTGKRRLPGFDGEWKRLKARNLFKAVTDKKHNGELQVLSATQNQGMIPRNQLEIDIHYDVSSLPSYKRVKPGNFVISLRSFQGGIEYSEYDGIVSPAYTVLESAVPICDLYYKQYFKSARYISLLQSVIYGIRDGKQINYEDFGSLEIHYPPIEEQAAIADILSAADREIELLRRELDLQKRQKKSLAQLLLTGLVRLS